MAPGSRFSNLQEDVLLTVKRVGGTDQFVPRLLDVVPVIFEGPVQVLGGPAE